MVHALVEGLIERDHEVVLVGAGTPGCSAKLLQTYEVPPLERLGQAVPEIVHALLAAEQLEDLDVDVVHDNSTGSTAHTGPGGGVDDRVSLSAGRAIMRSSDGWHGTTWGFGR